MVVYYGKATPASGGSGGGSGDAVWGSITGTLSDQTDLANALAEKQDTLTAGTGIDITNDVISATGGSVSFDGTTINENASNELQAVGVVNQNTASGATTPLKLWEGTEEEWNVGGGTKDSYYDWDYSKDTKITVLSGTTVSVFTGCYGNGKFIMLPGWGLEQNNTVLYSSDGTTWNTSTMPSTKYWSAAAYGNGKYVALTWNTDTAAYSTDGITWNNATLPSSVMWTSVAYGNGKFIAVSRINEVGAISTDGETWTALTTPPYAFEKIIYAGDKFIAFPTSLAGKIFYTTNNGATWVEITMPNSTYVYKNAAYGNGIIVASSTNEGVGAYSTDGGITWQSNNKGNMILAYSNGCFVGFHLDTKEAVYSYNGLDWTVYTLSSLSEFYSFGVNVADNEGNFCTFSNNTADLVMFSILRVFTSEEIPTTSSTVYSAPAVTSALTITAVGTGTITLSDTNTYTYNAGGNAYSYYSVGESYPNYVCNIDGVGLKIGDNDIANLASYTAFTGATGSVAGSAGLVPAPAATDNDKYLKGDGTWATVSGGGLQNTATGSDSLTILGTPNTTNCSVNIGISSEITAGSEHEGGTAIGWWATATDYGTAIGSCDHGYGQGASSGLCGVAIGCGALAGIDSVAIGYDARDEYGRCIVLGEGAYPSASYQFVVSGKDANDYPTNYLLMDLTTGKIPNDRINGATGSFTSQDGKTVTVTNGVITSIV